MKYRTSLTIFLIVVFSVFGCQNTEYSQLNQRAKIEAKNIEIVKQAWSEWNNRNIEFFYDFYNQDNYQYYSPHNDPTPSDFNGIIKIMGSVWKNIPDITLNIKQIFASGDRVISMMVLTGTHTEEVRGFPTAENQQIESSVINIVRFENGKVVEEWENHDELTFLEQIGFQVTL